MVSVLWAALAHPRRSFGIIRARRFELVDAKDRPWATLGFDKEGEATLNLLNRDGRGELLLTFYEGAPELWLIAEGNTRARLAVVQEEVELEMLDANAHDCLKILIDGHGAPHIFTCKGQDEWTDLCAERGA
jgi:hypothetical protein